jgi:hypothetical protein
VPSPVSRRTLPRDSGSNSYRPDVGLGSAASTADDQRGSPWPHWHQLLDVPRPRVAETWMARGSGPGAGGATATLTGGATRHEPHALGMALLDAASARRPKGSARPDRPTSDRDQDPRHPGDDGSAR